MKLEESASAPLPKPVMLAVRRPRTRAMSGIADMRKPPARRKESSFRRRYPPAPVANAATTDMAWMMRLSRVLKAKTRNNGLPIFGAVYVKTRTSVGGDFAGDS
jgi:hypothetical protein